MIYVRFTSEKNVVLHHCMAYLDRPTRLPRRNLEAELDSRGSLLASLSTLCQYVRTIVLFGVERETGELLIKLLAWPSARDVLKQ